MQNITAAWLMKVWSDGDPVLVSLVQTAMFLPSMFLSLPAGLASDRANRQSLLIFAHTLMMATPLVIAALIAVQLESPILLLLMTACLAAGNALKLPAQSALLPDLVAKDQLPAAIGLNSLAVNGGRVLGPALSAGLLPVMGPATLLVLNALTYFSFIVILLRLKLGAKVLVVRAPTRLWDDVLELLRFTRRTAAFATVLRRSGLYFAAWAIVLAVLPLMVEDASQFGMIYANFGIGSIVGALVMDWVRGRLGEDATLNIAILGHAVLIAVLSLVHSLAAMSACLFGIGAMSFYAMSSLQIAAQQGLPRELRGRGIALMTMVIMGASALSSPVWGSLARAFDVTTALQAAAAFSIVSLAVTFRQKIGAQNL